MTSYLHVEFACLQYQPLALNQDHETAASAVRNLNNQDVGGRPLRIDLADSDPFLEGKTTVRGELVDSGESRAQWRERERDEFRFNGGTSKPHDPNAFMTGLPLGVPVPPGSTSLDTISNTLGTMNPTKLIEVLAQVKVSLVCIVVSDVV
jgi:cleavage stimulation factor subunit 2